MSKNHTQWARNKFSALVCPSTIPNGQLEKTCSYEVGSSCSFTCYAGYGSTTTRRISCGRNQQWDMDVRSLCGGIFLLFQNHGDERWEAKISFKEKTVEFSFGTLSYVWHNRKGNRHFHFRVRWNASLIWLLSYPCQQRSLLGRSLLPDSGNPSERRGERVLPKKSSKGNKMRTRVQRRLRTDQRRFHQDVPGNWNVVWISNQLHKQHHSSGERGAI